MRGIRLYKIIEQPRDSGFQSFKLVPEELLLCSSHFLTLSGMYIISIRRNHYRAFPDILNLPLNIYQISVIYEVLQVVSIPALTTFT